MKAVKIILGVLLVLVLVIAIAMYFVFQNIDSIVKEAVEKVGPQVTLTDVELNSAKIELQKGRGQLSGLSIANPQGFSADKIFRIDNVVVDIEPASVTQKVIVIDEILIDGARLLAEQKGLKDTNVQALLDNLKKSSSGAAVEAETETGPDVRLMVKKLSFVNASVDFKSEQLGAYQQKLPAINVANIGDTQEGLTPEQLGIAILQPVLQQVKNQIADELQNMAKDKAKEKLQEEIGKQLSPEDQQKLEGLKGLLKGKKE